MQVVVKTDQLVKDVVPAAEGGIMSGPKFALKTSLAVDLAVSLASGKDFLGRFSVPSIRNACLVSTESGIGKLQRTIKGVVASKGIDIEDLAGRFSITTKIPSLDNTACLVALEEEIEAREASLSILDAAYMMMGRASRDVGNKFAMGDVLGRVSEIIERTGCSILLVCHNNKHRKKGEEFGPPDPQDIAMSGFLEWGRWFVLLERQKPWETGVHQFNQHSLWMDAHGSQGHAGLWSAEVKENFFGPAGPLRWEPFVQSGSSPHRRRHPAKRSRSRKTAREIKHRTEGKTQDSSGTFWRMRRNETHNQNEI